MGALDLIVSQREREEYDNDPVVQTIKALPKDGGEWKGSAAEIMQKGKALCGKSIATSPQSLSSVIKKLEPQLFDYNGISHERAKNGSGGGCHYFYCRSWTDIADLQEEISM